MERVIQSDDNAELVRLLNERLAKGQRVYGHGIQVDDGKYDWLEMAIEELLDASLYFAAEILRRRRQG